MPRKCGEWPALEDAAKEKIAEQKAFVAEWDERVRPPGNQPNNAAGDYLAVAEAYEKWGIAQPTISRWRTSLKHPDK